MALLPARSIQSWGWLCCLEDGQGALAEKVTSELDREVDTMLARRGTKALLAGEAWQGRRNWRNHIWSPDLEV